MATSLRSVLGIFFLVLVVAACGTSDAEPAGSSIQAAVPTTVEAARTASPTSTLPPTPAEQLRSCVLGTENDEVTCAGARTVVAAEDEVVAMALEQLASCEAEEADCADATDLVVRAVEGEDVSDELGPGPDEVWAPDIALLQALFDQINQANDTAGVLGTEAIYAAASEPASSVDLFKCVGSRVDHWRQFGATMSLFDSASAEYLVDFSAARRTDSWTLRSPTGSGSNVDPAGRTYAFVTTVQFGGIGAVDLQTTEVHGHIGEDGNAYVFSSCSGDYVVQNPNETTQALTEAVRRLDEAGIWQDYWKRPDLG